LFNHLQLKNKQDILVDVIKIDVLKRNKQDILVDVIKIDVLKRNKQDILVDVLKRNKHDMIITK